MSEQQECLFCFLMLAKPCRKRDQALKCEQFASYWPERERAGVSATNQAKKTSQH